MRLIGATRSRALDVRSGGKQETCPALVAPTVLVALVALVVALVTSVVLSTAAHADQLRISQPTTALDGSSIQSANVTTHGSALLTVNGVAHAYFAAQPSQGPSGAQAGRLVSVTPGGRTSPTSVGGPVFDVAADSAATSKALFATSGASSGGDPSISVFSVDQSGSPATTASQQLGFTLTQGNVDVLAGYVASYVVVDSNRHRGYVSLSRTGHETYIGEFATGGGAAALGVVGVVDAQTTTGVRLAVDQQTGSVYYAELGGTAVRRLRMDGTSLGTIDSLNCLQIGDGQLGAIAVAGGTVYVADLANQSLWRTSDIASTAGSCTASSIDVGTSLPGGVVDLAATAIVSGATTTYRLFAASVSACTNSSGADGCLAILDPASQALAASGMQFGVQALLPVTTPGAPVGTVLAVGQSSSAKDVDTATVSSGGTPGAAALTPTTLPYGTVSTPYSAVVTTTGGTATPNLTAAWSGVGPAGLSITTAFDGMRITGTPTGTGTFSLVVTWSGGPTVLPLTITSAACSSSNVSASRPGTTYPKYTATTSDECTPWGLAALAGGSPVSLSGYRSAQHTDSVPQRVSIDEGMITKLTSIAITPASSDTGAYPRGATVLASNTDGCPVGTSTVTVTANLQASVTLTPPSGAYRYVCLVVSTLPAGGPVTDDPTSGHYFALGSFAVTTCQCSVFSPSALPRARVVNYYSQTVSFSSGSLNTQPTSTTLTASPALPSGLSLAAGVASVTLSGNPLVAGTYSLTAKGVAGGQTSSTTYSLAIDPPVAFLDATAGKLTLPSATVCQQTLGCPYDATLRVRGGPGLTVAVVPGTTLPAGLQLTKASDGSWHLSGRLSPQVVAGNPAFSLRASDDDTAALPVAGSQTVTATLPVTAPAVTFSPTTLPTGQVGQAYRATIAPSPTVSLYLNHVAGETTLTTYGLTVAVVGMQGAQHVEITGTPNADLLSAGALTFTVCAAGTPETCRDYLFTATGSSGPRASGGTSSGSGGTGGYPDPCAKSSVSLSENSLVISATSSHECPLGSTYGLAALFFDGTFRTNASGYPAQTPEAPASLLGYLTALTRSAKREIVRLDLGSVRPVAQIAIGTPSGGQPANPTLLVSATSPDCSSDVQAVPLGSVVTQAGSNVAVPTWLFTPTQRTNARYVCFSGDTVALTGAQFGDLAGWYGYELTSLRVQGSVNVTPAWGTADSLPAVGATLRLTSTDGHTINFTGTGWTGLVPRLVTLACSRLTPGYGDTCSMSPVTGTATVNGDTISGSVSLTPGVLVRANEYSGPIISVLATSPSGSRVATGTLRLDDEDLDAQLESSPRTDTALRAGDVVTDASGVIVYTDDPSTVSVSFYGAGGAEIAGANGDVRSLPAGNNVLGAYWASAPSVYISPAAGSSAIKWARIVFRAPSGAQVELWWDRTAHLSYTKP